VLLLPWAIALVWRRASAAHRHLMWSLTLVALIVLPVCRIGLPQWPLAVLPAAAPPPLSAVASVATDRVPKRVSNQAPRSLPNQAPKVSDADPIAVPMPEAIVTASVPPGISALTWLWIAGAVVSLALVGVRHLALALGARPWSELTDPAVIALTRRAAEKLLVGLPRILQAESRIMPIVWCWRRPTLVLPASASAWPPEQLWAVLLHELAHIRRRDCLTQFLGQIACALYWFHPLAWLAAHGNELLAALAKEHKVTVTVRDAAGRPVPGATVYLVESLDKQTDPSVCPRIDSVYPTESGGFHGPVATSNNRGQATLQASSGFNALIVFGSMTASILEGPQLRLMARAPGKGLATLPVRFDQTDATLDLAPQTMIEGTLRTPDGGPARDVRVHAASIKSGSEWVSYYSTLHKADYMPQDVITDANGHFAMQGMPAGGEALLQIFSDRFARLEFYVSTGVKQAEEKKRNALPGLPQLLTLPPRFTLALKPARIFEGRITDKDSGKPLAGVDVSVWPATNMLVNSQGRTDADGHYKIGSYQSAQTEFMAAYGLFVQPAVSSGWLGVKWDLPQWPDVTKTVFTKDFALTRGRLIEGRIIEAENGRPVANATVAYRPKPGNKLDEYARDRENYFECSTFTDEHGKFTVTGLPGPGFIIANDPRFAGVKLARSESGGDSDIFPQGYAKIDVPETGSMHAVDITLKRGITLEARAVQPNGKPVPYVMVLCREQDQNAVFYRRTCGRRFETGLFRLPSCEAGKSYHALFLQPELNLGAVVDLVADPKRAKPIEVQLQPTASLSGRVVNENGTPIRDVQTFTEIPLIASPTTILSWDHIMDDDQWAIYMRFFGEQLSEVQGVARTDVKGEFRLGRLVPGANMYMFAAAKHFRAAQVAIPPLKPGESRDVGTLVLKKRKPKLGREDSGRKQAERGAALSLKLALVLFQALPHPRRVAVSGRGRVAAVLCGQGFFLPFSGLFEVSACRIRRGQCPHAVAVVRA
jgi:beta-lactamase regulating signal transducer with metallopeptidase domain